MRTGIGTAREMPDWLLLAIFTALAVGSSTLYDPLISHSAIMLGLLPH